MPSGSVNREPAPALGREVVLGALDESAGRLAEVESRVAARQDAREGDLVQLVVRAVDDAAVGAPALERPGDVDERVPPPSADARDRVRYEPLALLQGAPDVVVVSSATSPSRSRARGRKEARGSRVLGRNHGPSSASARDANLTVKSAGTRGG